MAPARKKSRFSNDNEPDPSPSHHIQQQQPAPAPAPQTAAVPLPDGQSCSNTIPTQPPSPSNKHAAGNRGSWYSSGSWRSKASPVAQVARESISVDKGVSSEASSKADPGRRPSQSVSKSFKGSRKSIPLLAETSKVYATSDASSPSWQKRVFSGEEKASGAMPKPVEEKQTEVEQVEETPQPSEVVMKDTDSKAETASIRPASGTWFGWWSRPDGYSDAETGKKSDTKARLDGADAGDVGDRPATDTPQGADASYIVASDGMLLQPGESAVDARAAQTKPALTTNTSSRSWFGLWSSSQNQQAKTENEQAKSRDQQQAPTEYLPAPDVSVAADPKETAKDVKEAEPTKSVKDEERPKTSAWAFWSSDKFKDTALQTDGDHKQIGQLAVADTPSQSHPEVAQFNQGGEQRNDNKAKKPAESKRASSLLRRTRGRSEKSKDLSGETTAAATPVDSQLPTPAVTQHHTPSDTPEASPAPVQRGKQSAHSRPNLILPAFRDTYPAAPNPGVLDRLTKYVGETLRLPGYGSERPTLHPFVSSTPPKIQKAIAIGIHGYFPAPLFQRVLGQPTGTSIRFANYAAASVKQWCHDHQPEVKDLEVEKVALEGEGCVADRVTTLWKLLLNWLSHLRQADFIMVACHSQGVPVAIMLVAKLIQLGALSPHVRIGICAMAGVNLGPFLEYKSRLFGGTALELFDFCDSKSKVSIAYTDSLDVCLRHGVRLTFTGSIDDQLVSLESSLHAPLSHPYVNRQVFIDGRLHTPNFLTHLVVFAIKLRNLGVSDHGLLREISAPLAGSLVGGEGHSRVYDDPAVYVNAIEFALESTYVSAASFAPVPPTMPEEQKRKSMEEATQRRGSLASYPANITAANHMRRGSLSSLMLAPPGIAPTVAAYEAPGAVGAAEKNPFVLPWAVRGMLEEELVKQDAKMQQEVRELVCEFEGWRPTSKILKDVRWRLEGVRSML